MKIYKFFRFTIEGDELDPIILRDAVNLPCDVFIKGETVVSENLHIKHFQKTNRWLYRAELLGKTSVSNFLTKHLKAIHNDLPKLKEYIEKNDAYMELVLYAEDKTDINLNPKQIKLLSEIGVEFLISFC